MESQNDQNATASRHENCSSVLSFELSGIIEQIAEVEVKSSSFKMKNIVLSTTQERTNYEHFFEITFINNNVELLNTFAAGMKVKVNVNLNGKKFTKQDTVKYFPSLTGWRIEKIEESNE